jgi:type I restriction enzyme S subunit
VTPEIKNRIEQIWLGKVPEGYKATLAGIIPVEWQCDELKHCINICNEKRKPISKEMRKKMAGPYPYYGPTQAQGYIDTYMSEGPAVLIGEDGDHFLKFRNKSMTLFVDGEYTVNNHAHIITGTERCATRWFYYTYQHKSLLSAITRQGAGRYKLTKEALEKLPLQYPGFKEQNQILAIITPQDKVIELKEKLIAEKQRQKKYLMQQLFTGKARLPGFTKKWCTIRLKNIAHKEKLKNIGFEYSLVLSNSAQHGIIPQEEQFAKEIANTDRIDEYYVVKDGYFVYNPRISTTAPCGPININETGYTGVISPLYTVFSIDCDYIDNSYMKQYFKSTCWFRHMKSVANYGARHDRMSITDDDFFAMPISVPELKEQQEISAIFAVVDKEIELLQQSLEQEKQKKKALMQLLLTGIVRVII